MNKIKPINLKKKFSLFNETWTPKIIAELNGQYVKLCKLKNNFVWHKHTYEDELFLVIQGTLYIDFRDQETVNVNEGEIIIIPKGVEHKPYTKENEVVLNLLFEPKTTLHTGDTLTQMTVKKLDWI